MPTFYDYAQGNVLYGAQVEPPIEECFSRNSDPLKIVAETVPHIPWEVTTVRENGPTDNRVDLVFVGDGYTSSELGDYSDQVESMLLEFFGEPPFDTYATFFNVHRVDVISAESGVDNDPEDGIERNTALDMRFHCGGNARMLCVSTSKARAAAGVAADADQILAIANSAQSGGAGYPGHDLGTVAGASPSAAEITLHEFGHTFGNLADEYNYGGPENYPHADDPPWPNASTYDANAMTELEAKWHLWLDEPNIDTFDGADHSKTDVYRPTANSKMRNLNRPFEQVNVEQLVVNAYKTVRPIDDATPAGVYPQATAFFVDPVDPVGHHLDIQWSLDGGPIPGATATTFDAASLRALPGTYELSVGIVDNTDLVRDQELRNQWMSDERTWTLTVELLIENRLAGDVDGDGAVAFRDLVILADNFGQANASWEDGDFDSDGTVGFSDLTILANNYGRSCRAIATDRSGDLAASDTHASRPTSETCVMDAIFADRQPAFHGLIVG